MLKKICDFFKKTNRQQVLQPFVVEMQLMLDENTQLSNFVGIVHAKSKKDAKWQVKNRAFVKVGAVVNKAQVETFKNKTR